MKIATWNVNSIAIRLEQVLNWLETTETDVLCLQETKTVDEKFPYEAIENAGYKVAFHGQKSYNGVAILSKYEIKDLQRNFPDDDADAPKRLIAATVENIRIVNTYIPNGTELWTDKFTFKLDWLQRLRRFFDATCPTDSDVLLCGDFNVAPDERDVWKAAFYKIGTRRDSSRQTMGFYGRFQTNQRRREKIFLVELPRRRVFQKSGLAD